MDPGLLDVDDVTGLKLPLGRAEGFDGAVAAVKVAQDEAAVAYGRK